MFVAAGLLLLTADRVQAITWDFAQEGDNQGWRVQEGFLSGASTTTLSVLPSEVRDGIWRVSLAPFEAGRSPAIALTSPRINRDSALFDRVAIRFRVVHSRPIENGQFQLLWTNPANRNYRGSTVSGDAEGYYFVRFAQVNYTADWQEVVLSDLHSGPVEGSRASPILWEGELSDIRLQMGLSDSRPGQFTGGPEDVPEAVEIDWIKLTGVEEQLQGELPPPPVTPDTPFGDLFAESVFNPLEQKGIGSWPWTNTSAALGDLDGDGDSDLVATYFDSPDNGWLVAFNDGRGNFSHPTPNSTPFLYLQANDLDDDGWLDVLVTEFAYDTFKLLHNEEEAGWVVAQKFDGFYALGMVDADGDQDADLWMIEDPAGKNALWLFYNNGAGYFEQKREIPPPEERFGASKVVQHLRQGKATGILWTNHDNKPGYKISYLDEAGELVQEHLAIDMNWDSSVLIRYAGDFDLDGDVDLIAGKERTFAGTEGNRGLRLNLNTGAGGFETIEWYDDVSLLSNVEFFDLNQDGLLDPVFVDSDERNPAVIVNLGVKGELPVQEGRYPLRGAGGAVLGGDVDGDGDIDLVVLERAIEGQGGVHVLLNRLAEQRTAVEEEKGPVPGTFRLEPAYPNPFNPGVVIPFTLGASEEKISLAVYNTLGQEVLILELGELPAGSHQVQWDGRDRQGVELSSGVYLYRLQAGTWGASGKMVKSE
jgi:hypothetical protein